MKGKSTVFMIGAFPPPVHGLSNMNQTMMERLRQCAHVIPFDTTWRGGSQNKIASMFCRLLDGMRLIANYCILMILNRPVSLYVALSGGKGQIRDAVFLIIGRFFGVRVFVHHHSFRYINKRDWVTYLIFSISGRVTHIVLCEDMAARLRDRYDAVITDVRAISNAEIIGMKLNPHIKIDKNVNCSSLTIGFLSNITREKGIFRLFDIVGKLKGQGVDLNVIIAGPLDEGIREQFEFCVRSGERINYIGPAYNEKKESFFRSIDLLVFPSAYENEAEPLTIIEAMSRMIPVIATSRGCIRSLLVAGGGVVYPDDSDFERKVADFIKYLSQNPAHYEKLSREAFERAMYQTSVDNNIAALVSALLRE
ncbi:glycosyltransferase family 4 protein [Burkholderia sp. Bp8990]|uniref:glycosyltransferase family 4 protein n=1 Tax=Burkholderia sp. Bp8990 TaxID=2184552 RepID=UPI000F5A9456|nr:glycosyltransferase family 4 protein [Burkholderia sp. Bp8990]RQS31144.1 glycosyltransferase family 1 protein [Burkholderia sp. Bp8990]